MLILTRMRVWFRRNIYRSGKSRKALLDVRNFIPFLGMVYTAILTLFAGFAGFWVVWYFIFQLSDKKIKEINFLPENLDVGASLIPFGILAFGGFILAAQGSIKNNQEMSYRYGYAGRALLKGFYFLGMTFVLAIGNRILDENTFSKFRFASPLTNIVGMLDGFMYLNAAISMFIIVVGLMAYIRTFSQHED
ncbi:hypothetical protein [Deinococcus koreensis]|uniref:hypothetical protein n=1 Tax=Deinococcus koreensis TaxID=2054903 RepID=UPI0010570DEB|nr:hypothetical protein [Deinococcus koreensis]